MINNNNGGLKMTEKQVSIVIDRFEEFLDLSIGGKKSIDPVVSAIITERRANGGEAEPYFINYLRYIEPELFLL
jgi:hypothetical protein